ncbi:MAG: hypothetical protein OXG81_09330 [Acidobacteria bacterium]|nr:hypothetical protein [Acidobacteriota bacterium]
MAASNAVVKPLTYHPEEEFENGRDYYRFHGCQINAPDDIGLRPDPAVLTWHNDNCFMG